MTGKHLLLLISKHILWYNEFIHLSFLILLFIYFLLNWNIFPNYALSSILNLINIKMSIKVEQMRHKYCMHITCICLSFNVYVYLQDFNYYKTIFHEIPEVLD